MAKRYRRKVIRFGGRDLQKTTAEMVFVGGKCPYLWCGVGDSFVGYLDNLQDVRRLRQCCDEFIESRTAPEPSADGG